MNKTNIAFADYTWNPITGCNPVSEGCDNCYAKKIHQRFSKQPFSKIAYHPDRLLQPLKVKKPATIFVCSMGDIFHPAVEENAIDSILDVIAACPQHTFLMLTKRPENITEKLYGGNSARQLGGGDFYQNLWIGVTAENQARADERIPKLIKSWPGHRWVCIEPILSGVEISFLSRLKWVIVGNETGPKARHFNAYWVADLAAQCKAAGIPFFWKGKVDTDIWTGMEYVNRQEWPKYV